MDASNIPIGFPVRGTLRAEATLQTDTREFQPKKTSFMFGRITAALVVTAIVSVLLMIAVLVSELWVLLLLLPICWIAILLPTVFGAHVAYTKERYEVHGDHLVCHRGGLLSDGRTELDIRNVTHVRLRLPWLRHKLFKIGDVRVESAGSAASEITFQSIVRPEEVYEEVQELMRNNGYSLQRNETLHQESPGVMGAITDIVQTGIGVSFTLAIILAVIGGALADAGLSDGSALGVFLVGLGALFALATPVGALLILVVRYLDLTRRTYTVYDDAVSYTEGFLTRDNAVIPFENIADASTNRTVVDQVLGLYDVKVSCQGSGSEVLFRRLSRGEELKAAIATLVASAGKKAREIKAKPSTSPTDGPEGQKAAADLPSRKLVDPDEAWTADLQMNHGRAQASLLLLVPLIPVWALAAAGVFIKATKTTFSVGPNSISSAYSFLGASHQEFAYDKVTGVQVSRNPLDGFFDTVSLQIWSIGSPQPLSMPNMANADLDLPALLAQCGIPSADPAQGELKQSFGPKVWLIQNVFVLLTLMAGAFGLLIGAFFLPPLLVFIPFLVLLPLPMAIATSVRVKRQKVTFHDEHLEAQTGIFFRQHIYVRYDNIKKVESTQIPFTDQGRLKVYVAGERIQQQQNGQEGAGIKIPYSLEGGYIEGISLKVDAVDALMLGLIKPSEIEGEHAQDDDVISVSHPSLMNELVIFMAVGIFMPPIWLFAPVLAWQIKVRRYMVESDRVVLRSGILFKSVTSVLFNRIDSLQQNQGALGKAFGNGQVTILTAGSSSPDLNVANVPDYKEVYSTIREHYGKHDSSA